MKFRINKVEHEVIPIKDFRQSHNLPASFGVAQFEPKDYRGLGRLDSAGSQLNDLRNHILHLIPASIAVQDLLEFVDRLQLQFQTDLFNINDVISLKAVEVEFAISGFGDMLRTLVYKMIPAHTNNMPMPPFDNIYHDWVNDSLRVSSQIHDFQQDGNIWHIQVINQVYGRVGLRIEIKETVIFVSDGIYLCPAEGFMYNLLKDVAHKSWEALQ